MLDAPTAGAPEGSAEPTALADDKIIDEGLAALAASPSLPTDIPAVDAVKYPGKVVRLTDGRDWVLPPFTFRQLRVLAADVFEVVNTNWPKFWEPDHRAKVVRVTHAALARNYPELTRDMVEDLISIESACLIIEALTGLNHYRELMARLRLPVSAAA